MVAGVEAGPCTAGIAPKGWRRTLVRNAIATLVTGAYRAVRSRRESTNSARR